MQEHEEDELEFISDLREARPDQYLRTLSVTIDGEIHHIGLFQCDKCGKPIADQQFNFTSGVCGPCDSPNRAPEWTIEKPEKGAPQL